MSRLMSVAYTEQAVVERRKTVTRRTGWWTDRNGRRLVVAGDTLTLCRKVMGRKPGEPLVRLCDVRIVNVNREVLDTITEDEVAREGFPGMDPDEFVQRFFVDAQGIAPDAMVTRIEWRYVDETDDDFEPLCGGDHDEAGIEDCDACQAEVLEPGCSPGCRACRDDGREYR